MRWGGLRARVGDAIAGAPRAFHLAVADWGSEGEVGGAYDPTSTVAAIPLKDLVHRRQTDLKFRLAVWTYTAFSTGAGYHLSTPKHLLGTKAAKRGIELIEEWAKAWHLDAMNQLIAADVWTSGNAFLYWADMPRKRRGMPAPPGPGVGILPLSSIVEIRRDESGAVEKYVQVWGASRSEVEPDKINHFRWAPEDASAWGTGLGQPLARRGIGYRTGSGKLTKRPPWFQISEMIDDVSAKITYAGVPRWLVSGKDIPKAQSDELTQILNRLDPLQHVATNLDLNISTLALETAARFDPLLTKLDNQMINGVMTPIPRLWSSLNFTYASSKEAIEAAMPLVRMYQRAHAEFVEQELFARVLVDDGRNLKTSEVELVWGPQEAPTIDDVKAAWDILSDHRFDGLYDPADIVEMLRDAGLQLTPVAELSASQEIAAQLREIRTLREHMPARTISVADAAEAADTKARAVERVVDRKLKMLARLDQWTGGDGA